MVFNVEVSKVIHFEHGNKNFSYETGGLLLQSVDEEYSYCPKVIKGVNAVRSTNIVLCMIRWSFVKNEEIIFPLYISIVRPRLEFYVQGWGFRGKPLLRYT